MINFKKAMRRRFGKKKIKFPKQMNLRVKSNFNGYSKVCHVKESTWRPPIWTSFTDPRIVHNNENNNSDSKGDINNSNNNSITIIRFCSAFSDITIRSPGSPSHSPTFRSSDRSIPYCLVHLPWYYVSVLYN